MLMRNLATILPLKSKLYGKFQCFNAIDGNIEMLQNSYEAQTVNHFKEIIQPYSFHILSDKISLRLWNKNWGRGQGNASWRFRQCFFFNFLSSANHGGQHFYSALQRYSLSFFILNTFKTFFGKPSILWKIWK